jgi:hypothetical protein
MMMMLMTMMMMMTTTTTTTTMQTPRWRRSREEAKPEQQPGPQHVLAHERVLSQCVARLHPTMMMTMMMTTPWCAQR